MDITEYNRILTENDAKIAEAAKPYRDNIKNAGVELLKETFQSIFERFPYLQKLMWTQYTPTYNDGEDCNFKISGPCYSFPKEYLNSDDNWGSFDENYYEYDYWIFKPYATDRHDSKLRTQQNFEFAEKIHKSLNKQLGVLENSFGPSSKITVTKNESGELIFTVENFVYVY